MTGEQLRETERNIRANDLLAANAADFADIAAAVEMSAELTAKVAKVQQVYEAQMQHEGDARRDYEIVGETYDALRSMMLWVDEIAGTMERKIPSIEKLFRLPRGRGRRTLITAARVFVANAAQYEAEFDRNGVKKDDFLTLTSRADELETALNEAAATTGERVGATSTLEQDVDDASDIVDAIDPIARRIYRDNPTKLAAWKFASRVERHTPVPRPLKPKPEEAK